MSVSALFIGWLALLGVRFGYLVIAYAPRVWGSFPLRRCVIRDTSLLASVAWDSWLLGIESILLGRNIAGEENAAMEEIEKREGLLGSELTVAHSGLDPFDELFEDTDIESAGGD